MLLTLRAFRPLRLISLVPGLRHVFYELFLGWRKLVLALILLLVFIFFFASLGVQLFAGVDSPEGFCNDPSREEPKECVGEFLIDIQVSLQESLPLRNSGLDTYLLVPRVWSAITASRGAWVKCSFLMQVQLYEEFPL